MSTGARTTGPLLRPTATVGNSAKQGVMNKPTSNSMARVSNPGQLDTQTKRSESK